MSPPASNHISPAATSLHSLNTRRMQPTAVIVQLPPAFLLPLLLLLFLPTTANAVAQLQFRVSLSSPEAASFPRNSLRLEVCAREFRWWEPTVEDFSSELAGDCKFGYTQIEVQSFGQQSLPLPPFSHSWRQSFVFSIRLRRLRKEESRESERKVLLDRSERVFDLQAGSPWRSAARADFSLPEGEARNFSLDVRYRIDCAVNFFGPGCDVRCELSDWERRTGHFECSHEDGLKRCAHGWMGARCTEPEVLSSNTKAVACNCANGGKCVPSDGPITCLCPPGFGGNRCEKCMTNFRCKGFCQVPGECACPEGKGGQFCEKDLVFCFRHSPCQNGATCLNTPDGSYACECAPGFGGHNCERRLVRCGERPCRNGARCVPQLLPNSASGFRCECPPDFFGQFCQVQAAGGCADMPCQNGGSCADSALLALSLIRESAEVPPPFKCFCASGWNGQICDQPWESCAINPCRNGASCIIQPLRAGGFECRCPLGWEGTLCGDNVDDCRATPCLNGGTCVDGLNAFHCACRSGFGGELCQERETSPEGQRPQSITGGSGCVSPQCGGAPSAQLLPISLPWLLLLLFLLALFFALTFSSILSRHLFHSLPRQLPLHSSSSPPAPPRSALISVSTIPEPKVTTKIARGHFNIETDYYQQQQRYVSDPTFRIGAQSQRHLEQSLGQRMSAMGEWATSRRRDSFAAGTTRRESGVYEELDDGMEGEADSCCHRF